MPFEFRLADLGEGVQEGEIIRWLVQAGETVQPEQPLVEVMTDKVTAELPSPVAGTVQRCLGEPGDVVPVGSVLVEIETEAEPEGAGQAPGSGAEPVVHEAPLVATAPEVKTAAPEPAPAQGNGGIPLAVPAVRRLARELGLDLHAVRGSGPEGRITEADVRAAAGGAAVPAAPGTTRRVPLRGLRRRIAEHLLESHRTTAPYTYVEEVDFTDLVSLKERVQPLAEKAGARMTYLPFLIAAVSRALKEHPELNATADPESGDLVISEAQHLGVAVNTEEGLVVPVLHHVERRNLLDLAREIERLAAAARQGSLSREETQGGTFSITSLGPLGGIMATPMLNTPQVCILGVHKITPRPVVREGEIVQRQMGNLSLTLDHRYVDGFAGAAFIRTLRTYLEDPALMLFWLAELRDA
ncbi:MAG: dihydrolipoamide acetyltransferase family protein [Armatimonadota bacterium]